jgi:acyl carrier protein
MNHINLIVSVEEEFEIEIEEDKILDLMSFRALLDYIFSAVSEK